MPPPDFVIAGAPKCGTTALYYYLKQHPAIFMPSCKEPHFFGDDLPPFHRKYETLEAYQAIFDAASPGQLCGEASVLYMHSDVALARLQAHNPDVKSIAVLRNPVDLFVSWHNQCYKRLDEHYADPKQAWNAQKARKAGQDISGTCRHPELLVYGDVCALGTRLEHFIREVPAERRLILFYDDLVDNTVGTYSFILDFLGLEQVDDIAFEKKNVSVKPRSMRLEKLLQYPPLGLDVLRSKFKPVLNHYGIYPSRFLRQLNYRPVKYTLDPDFRAQLVTTLTPEIEKIELLTGRNLSHWRQVEGVCHD